MLNKIWFLFVCIPFFGISQSVYDSNESSDPAAKKILDQLSQSLESKKSVKLDFTIEFYADRSTTPEKSKGTLIYVGDQFRLFYQNQIIVSDGSTNWMYDKSFNELNISSLDPENENLIFSPTKIMNFYNTMDVSYAIVEEKRAPAGVITDIEFKPLDKNEMITKARMSIFSERNEIESLLAFLRDGSYYKLRLDQIEYDKPVDAGSFIFDSSKYPGIHIEDLRID